MTHITWCAFKMTREVLVFSYSVNPLIVPIQLQDKFSTRTKPEPSSTRAESLRNCRRASRPPKFALRSPAGCETFRFRLDRPSQQVLTSLQSIPAQSRSGKPYAPFI